MELDFFKYTQNCSGKRKATTSGEPESKKRRLDFLGDEENAESEEDGNDRSQGFAPTQKHRVMAKGSNVPACVETFAALKDRYQIPSHLLVNLSNSGYSQPTAIQSYGIPILLEVGRFTSSNV